jgi:hypothetical protein
VPLKIIYLIVRLVAALAVLVLRRDLAKEAELLVLRHEPKSVIVSPSEVGNYKIADNLRPAAADDPG